MYKKDKNKILEKYKIKIKISFNKNFFIFLKKKIKKKKFIKISFLKKGCKNKIIILKLTNYFKSNNIILNFKNYNLILNDIKLLVFYKSYFTYKKKNKKYFIKIKNKLMKNICKCGISFNLNKPF